MSESAMKEDQPITMNAFNDPALAQANKLFMSKQFEAAIPLYQKYIEERVDIKTDIDGLGNNQISIGYYQWFIPKWYQANVESKNYIGTAYDMLSLSYLSVKTKEEVMENGIKWYRTMIGKHPDSYPLHMGYANILGNKSIYEEAIEQFTKVWEMNPGWVRPLECMSYIYQYKRIQKNKASQIATQILTYEPENRVGLFILARNQKNPDTKIEKLKRVSQLHPKYARALNEIGIVYGGTKKMYNEAITWYTKCSEIAPEYASCYNNIGVNHQLMKDYDKAIEWYFKGIQKDKQYKAPHKNMSDVFDERNFKDEDIEAEIDKRKSTVHRDYYYYYMGLSYYDKRKYDLSLKYYMKAYDNLDLLAKDVHKLHNSTGITYDQMRNNEQALNYYQKCINANPKYHSAYYNIAIVHKRSNRTNQAIQWYRKAIQINPRYSYAYNNLGNIYKNQHNYEQAIKCYKKAVEYLSTYTLALANMGVCYLKINNYRQAFNAMARAKEILPTDNNNLSESNKSFLKDTIDQFDREGQIWRQNGVVTEELKNHLQNYDAAFKQLYQDKQPVNSDKIMKTEVLQILKLLKEDGFDLKHIDTIYHFVKKLHAQNEQYFHILPQIFVQYVHQHSLQHNRPVTDVQTELTNVTKRLLVKIFFESQAKGDEFFQERNLENVPFTYFNPVKTTEINLFRQQVSLKQYSDFYAELMRTNEATKDAYKEFKNLVDQVRKQSHGIPYGLEIKIPSQQQEQFPVILKICKQIFGEELTNEHKNQMLNDVFAKIKASHEEKKLMSLKDIEHQIKKVWACQITEILQKRNKEQKKTQCFVQDLLKGKILFECVEHIKKALSIVDVVCDKKGHKILKMENCLLERNQDVRLTIKVKEAVCELKLSLKQDDSQLHFIDSMQELQKSPIGCILNSLLMLCKGIQYPLLRNCHDIAEFLQEKEGDNETKEAALFALSKLSESSWAPK